MTLKFASIVQENEWESSGVSPVLKQVVYDGSEIAFSRWGWLWTLDRVLTGAEEEEFGGGAAHALGLATDVRISDAKLPWVDKAVKELNSRWTFDPRRPAMVVSYPRYNGDGHCIHIHVDYSTRRIK